MRYFFAFLLIFSLTPPAFSQEKYPPFFKDEPVQKCAKHVASVLTKDTNYIGSDLIKEANKYNRSIPEMTKTSNRAVALMQISLVVNIWLDAQENMRPGFSFNLHELGQGLLRICTFAVFEGIDPDDVLNRNF